MPEPDLERSRPPRPDAPAPGTPRDATASRTGGRPTLPAPAPWARTLRGFAPHLLSLLIPGISLTFLLTGPHPWYRSIAFFLPQLALIWVEARMGDETHTHDPATTPGWLYDGLVYFLAGVQLITPVLLGSMYASQSLLSMDMLMAVWVVGSASGFQIITAHELIHRRSAGERLLGRAVLCTVLQEHFYTEHIRGHHVRVGTPEDPATARFGETYQQFYLRTVPAQFRSAWRLECTRLGDPQMALLDARQLGNRVLHGLAVEGALVLGVALTFGPTALAAFVLQAFAASRLLEAVNYFEHWGLVRTEKRVRPVDSWDTHARYTYYGLIGLSRHSDHHAYATRPYQHLRVHQEAPILPRGYIGMLALVFGRNRRFQKLMTEELERRQLGPFLPTPR